MQIQEIIDKFIKMFNNEIPLFEIILDTNTEKEVRLKINSSNQFIFDKNDINKMKTNKIKFQIVNNYLPIMLNIYSLFPSTKENVLKSGSLLSGLASVLESNGINIWDKLSSKTK